MSSLIFRKQNVKSLKDVSMRTYNDLKKNMFQEKCFYYSWSSLLLTWHHRSVNCCSKIDYNKKVVFRTWSCHSRKACDYLCRFSNSEAVGKSKEYLGNPELWPRARHTYERPAHPKLLGDSNVWSPDYMAYALSTWVLLSLHHDFQWYLRRQISNVKWRTLNDALIWPVAPVMAAPHWLRPVPSSSMRLWAPQSLDWRGGLPVRFPGHILNTLRIQKMHIFKGKFSGRTSLNMCSIWLYVWVWD